MILVHAVVVKNTNNVMGSLAENLVKKVACIDLFMKECANVS